MTVAGVAVTTVAALLTIVGLTGGCDDPTDTTHYDRARVAAPVPAPAPVPPARIGYESTTWGE